MICEQTEFQIYHVSLIENSVEKKLTVVPHKNILYLRYGYAEI